MNTFLYNLDNILRRNTKITVFIIILLSVLLRAGYLVQITDSPLRIMHRWEESDMNFFHQWSSYLSEGNWLCDTSLHPNHSWHRSIAEIHFREHPAEEQMIEERIKNQDIGVSKEELLWQKWWGGKRYHQEPLYAYITGILYRLSDGNIIWVFIFQMILGVVSNLLVYLITRRYFGETAAVLAALLMICAGIPLFYEGVLLRTSLIQFFSLLLVYLYDRALHGGLYRWVIHGVLSGMAFLLKGPFLLFIIFVILFTFIFYKQPLKKAWKSVIVYLVVIAFTLAPLVARNMYAGVAPFGFASTGSIAFITANNAEASPYNIMQIELTQDILDNTGGDFGKAVLATLKTHSGPGSFLKLMWQKFTALWHHQDIPNNANFYFFRQYGFVLSIAFVTPFILSPLIILGLILALVNKVRAWPLYIMASVLFISLMAFFVLSRFRTPFYSVMIPFAGYAIYSLIRMIVPFQKWLILYIMILAGLFTWTLHPNPYEIQKIRYAEYAVTYEYHYIPRINRYLDEGNDIEVKKLFEELIHLEPVHIRSLNQYNKAIYLEDALFAEFYIEVYSYYAQYLSYTGRDVRASRMLAKAMDLRDSLVFDE